MRRTKATDKGHYIAVHEAGHAVVSLHLGRGLNLVSVIPGEDYYGRSQQAPLGAGFRPDIDGGPKTRDMIEKKVKIALAGSIAEATVRGRQNRVGARTDRHNAVELLSYITASNEEIGAYLDLLTIQTRQMLAKPNLWAAVEALAAQLTVRKHMTGAQARAVIYAANRAAQ